MVSRLLLAGTDANVCNLVRHGLNVFDIGVMAQICYIDDDTEDFSTVLSNLLADDWELRKADDWKSHRVVFYDFYSPSRGLSVIAVRGTNPDVFWDIVQDLDLWYVARLCAFALLLS